ncbi:hypothetical protein ASF12_06245 [Paenibacillus sp. Leaf72]|nr:hypothetical protein ASF12_06245 [Paenibacillus sp. Leaf72]
MDEMDWHFANGRSWPVCRYRQLYLAGPFLLAWHAAVHSLNGQRLRNHYIVEAVSFQNGAAYAKVLNATPLCSTPNDKLKLRLDLAITKADGDTFQVTMTKEIRDTMLARLQPGTVIKVTYSTSDPSKIVLALPAEAADLKQTFGF